MNRKRIEETGTTHKMCADNYQEAMTIAQSMLLSFLDSINWFLHLLVHLDARDDRYILKTCKSYYG
jgi:hypothetical protein